MPDSGRKAFFVHDHRFIGFVEIDTGFQFVEHYGVPSENSPSIGI